MLLYENGPWKDLCIADIDLKGSLNLRLSLHYGLGSICWYYIFGASSDWGLGGEPGLHEVASLNNQVYSLRSPGGFRFK